MTTSRGTSNHPVGEVRHGQLITTYGPGAMVDLPDRSVVIGYSFLERAQWGTGANREMKSLMIAHANRWAETVLFHVSPGNMRSQRALEKIGAPLLERTEVLVGGVMSPRHIFAIRRSI
jgi:RimJ/RimL family protein N-acetyltransferase